MPKQVSRKSAPEERPPLKGRPKRKDRLRNDILEAASELFMEEGYELVTVRQIAERVDYSQSVIYTHFKDKADILNTICRETFSILIERFHEISVEKTGAEQRLLMCSRELILFGRRHPHHFRTVFLAPRERDGVVTGHAIESIGEPLFKSFGIIYRACIAERIFKVQDPHLSAVTWWANIVGMTAFLVVYEDVKALPNREAMIEESLRTLMRGLKGNALHESEAKL